MNYRLQRCVSLDVCAVCQCWVDQVTSRMIFDVSPLPGVITLPLPAEKSSHTCHHLFPGCPRQLTAVSFLLYFVIIIEGLWCVCVCSNIWSSLPSYELYLVYWAKDYKGRYPRFISKKLVLYREKMENGGRRWQTKKYAKRLLTDAHFTFSLIHSEV